VTTARPYVVRRSVRRQRGALARSTALITVWQVCEALVPVTIGVVIDRAVATGDLGQMVLWGVVLCVQFAVLSTGWRLGSRVFVRAAHVESHRLRTEVSGHVLADRGARTDTSPGDLLTVATGDAEQVSEVVAQISMATAAILGFVVTGVVLATIDPLLTVLVLVGVPVVLGVTQLLSRPLTARSEVRQAALGRATGVASDLVQGLRPLAGIGGVATALGRYRASSREAAETSVSAARWEGAMYGATNGLSGLFLLAVALVAGDQALSGDLSIGELVAVVGLAQFVEEPVTLLTFLLAQLAQGRASATRIEAVLATPPVVVSGDAAPLTDRPGLALRGVAHGPLAGLDLAADPGELVVVAADDPADAATLMALLRGETAPDAGEVLLGGTPLTDLDLAGVRRLLVVADHHVDLFAGDLRSNVDPAGTLDDATLNRVLRASAADDVVATAAGGLDEPVRVGGTTLSGGQRQRLGLARALAADPPVLVLHDPTTAVDAVTEQRIGEHLRAARAAGGAGRATLLLSSSPALLARADRVVHVQHGRVARVGTHHELLADPDYRAVVLR